MILLSSIASNIYRAKRQHVPSTFNFDENHNKYRTELALLSNIASLIDREATFSHKVKSPGTIIPSI